MKEVFSMLFPDHTITSSGTDLKGKTPYEIVQSLQLPHSNWFIAGGSLLELTNDIDVYFYTEEDFDAATTQLGNCCDETRFARTYLLDTSPYEVQLIKKSFGSPQEILPNFDLNKSRQAQLSDGSRYRHPSFHKDLHANFNRLSIDTVKRLLKYIYRKNQTINKQYFQDLITHLVEHHSDSIEDYYGISTKKYTKCNLLYDIIYLFPIFTADVFNAIDQHPIATRHAIYSTLIPSNTILYPCSNFSPEQQLYTSLRHIKSYYIKQSFFTTITTIGKRLDSNLQPPDEVLRVYPEYFI